MDVLLAKVQDRTVDFIIALQLHIIERLPYIAVDSATKLDTEWKGLVTDLQALCTRNASPEQTDEQPLEQQPQ